MDFENSLKWITEFWKENQSLVEQIQKTSQDAATDIKKLADALNQNRQLGNQLALALDGTFQVGPDNNTRQTQSELVDKIADLNKKIEKFRDSPEITAPLLTRRSDLYIALADTFDNSVEEFVQFTPEEIDKVNSLLQEAEVDAEHRQNLADLLNATVALAEMALQVAVKVAAA